MTQTGAYLLHTSTLKHSGTARHNLQALINDTRKADCPSVISSMAADVVAVVGCDAEAAAPTCMARFLTHMCCWLGVELTDRALAAVWAVPLRLPRGS